MVNNIKKYAITGGFIFIIVVGLLLYRNDRSTETDISSIELEEDPALKTTEEEEQTQEEQEVDETFVVVDVKGGVSKPGVYELSANSRVVDAIESASGFTDNALEAEMNLAQKVEDEMAIYVPVEGDEVTEHTPTTLNPSQQDGEGQVKINEASEDELMTLSGIGPAKAEAIIAYREEHGPFQQLDDLLEISGIGEKTLEQFEDTIVVP